MSYFSDSDDEKNSYISGSDDSDEDDEPTTSPRKSLNKEPLEDELIDEDNINDSENDEDDIGMSDTDADEDDIEFGEDDDDEIERLEETKKSESKKDKEKEKEKEKEKSKKSKLSIQKFLEVENEDDEDDYDDENYLQKFSEGISENYILNNHPECIVHNYNEVLSMCSVIKDANGIIIDDLHKTIPYLTKYERARILGIRAKQINCGATPFIKLSEGIIDGYIIAEMELKEKKIPFIVRRPMPNGGSEYWFLKDLEDLSF
jgi:DNA-directed RNA polymerase I, II, and III subunit RPABC2